MRFLYLLSLASKSAWNRKATLLLIVFSIALSSTLLLGIERIRLQMRENFIQVVSGTDLIIGARGSPVQLMLYALFHLGGATNNMSWESAQTITQRDEVQWAIPLSLGDSHKGYPVVATNENLFQFYRYQRKKTLSFAKGTVFKDLFDVVVGAEVAQQLTYDLNSEITLTHGHIQTSLTQHEDKPFRVVGVLVATGTPIDRSLYINLEAMEAIHLNWQGGAPIPKLNLSSEQVRKFDLTPKSITALLVGLKKRGQVFAVQRSINRDKDEALMAVMPGVALDQLWTMMAFGEKALLLISSLVTITGLAGLAASILSGLGERRRELAILRSSGARPYDILVLLATEGFLLVFLGVLTGIALLTFLTLLLSPFLLDWYGFSLSLSWPKQREWMLILAIGFSGFLTCLIPAYRAYRMSLADGLTVSL